MNNNDKHTKILYILDAVAEGVDRNMTVSGARCAAAVVHKNRIISVSTNSKQSHPFQLKYSSNSDAIYLHAETAAIHIAARHLSERQFSRATLYICRVKHISGPGSPLTWGISKPCIGCERAIVTHGIRKVIYSVEGTGNYKLL